MQSTLLVRLFRILNIIDNGPVTIEIIQKQLQRDGIFCSNRTIYRDLIRLADCFSFPNLKIEVIEGEFNKKKWMLVKSGHKKESINDDQYFRYHFIDQSKPLWITNSHRQFCQGIIR